MNRAASEVSRWALIAVIALTLSGIGLTACGKKGDLEAPPGSEWNDPDPQNARGHGFDS